MYAIVSKFIYTLSGLIIGAALSILVIFYFYKTVTPQNNRSVLSEETSSQKSQVIGFLPYWLLSKANSDYSRYITTLTYFSLTLDKDGKIKKMLQPQESEPGWYALKSGKADKFLNDAKKNNMILSLAVFNGNPDDINNLISNPVENAKNTLQEIVPVMKQHGFTDLNLDIENVVDATGGARLNFTKFVKEIKSGLQSNNIGTLTVDISPIDFFKKRMIEPESIINYIDYLLIMGYDFHYSGSIVSGPVSPLYGAKSILEFDIKTAVDKSLENIPASKIILGIPLYGYEWETIQDSTHSAVIPGSGLTASNARVEEILKDCTNCNSKFDTSIFESYLIYQDENTGAYHQIFYPDKAATKAKIKFAQEYNLSGLALWALGYEGKDILDPLENYISN